MNSTALYKLLLAACLLWGETGMAAIDPVQAGYRAYQQEQWRDAYEYWAPEADRGNAAAQFYLSRLFQDGLGVEPSPVTALTLLIMAAEGGHGAAAYRLGNLYHTGELIEGDRERALYWWRQAAEQGDESAQLRLAALYYLGWMVERDLQQAREWYGRAAGSGSQRAALMLDRLATMKSPRFDKSVDLVQVGESRAIALLPEPAKRAADAGSSRVAAIASGQSLRLQGESVTAADAALAGAAATLGASIADTAVVDDQNDLNWIAAQPEENFTLQLFSSDKRDSAERLARTLKSPWRVTILPFDRFGYRWFGVLAGSFDTLEQAKQAKQQLLADNPIEAPWVRRFRHLLPEE